MPRLVDFRCSGCKELIEDEFFHVDRQEDVPKFITCEECGCIAHQIKSGQRNFIHPSISSMYGKPQPAFGNIVMEDYAHKQRLLEEFGVQEANDAIGGTKKRSDEARHQHYLAEKKAKKETGPSEWISGPGGSTE
jgi:hypothetical protein